MSKSDKKVAIFDDVLSAIKNENTNSIYSILALLNGKNKNLAGYEELNEYNRKNR